MKTSTALKDNAASFSKLDAFLLRSRKDKEAWRYTPLSKLLERPRSAAQTLPGQFFAHELPSHNARLIFVNGQLRLEQSSFGDLSRGIVQDDGAEGYRLSLPSQTCLVTAPIECIFIADGLVAETATRFSVDLGESASLTLIERHVATNADVTNGLTFALRLGRQSKLVHHKIVSHHQRSAHLARTDVHVEEGAYYQNFALLKDAWLARNEIDVTLAGPLSQCTLNGVMLVRGHEHIDTSTRTLHAAPYGTSRQLYKTVLAEAGHGVFQGKIVVAEGAQKTDGRQLSRALLLSDQAEMDAKPELQIFADDVSCSHGSTVGDLDAETLFYLRARGLNEVEARALLLRAFVADVIDEVPAGQGRDILQKEAGTWFDEQNS